MGRAYTVHEKVQNCLDNSGAFMHDHGKVKKEPSSCNGSVRSIAHVLGSHSRRPDRRNCRKQFCDLGLY
jgi:hypothetical protein